MAFQKKNEKKEKRRKIKICPSKRRKGTIKET